VLGAALQDGIAEVVQAAGGAQGLVLAEVFDGKVGEFAGRILNEIPEDGLLIVSDQVDLVNGRDFVDGGEAVPDNGVAGDVKEGLRKTKCQSYRMLRDRWGLRRTLGTSRESGRNRVPREAPPTCDNLSALELYVLLEVIPRLTRMTALVGPPPPPFNFSRRGICRDMAEEDCS
jgi:hypothetical protein